MIARHPCGGRMPRAMLLTALLTAALLLPRAWAGWADVALLPPGESELHPGPEAYRAVSWTPKQVDTMRRRALLQLLAEDSGPGQALASLAAGQPSGPPSAGPTSKQLPVCELNLGYRVVDVGAANLSSIVTLTNNRELDLTHWQIVYRYAAFQHTVLTRADGAIALSTGSPAGAPVRLVDTFSSDGVPAAGGTFSFLAQAQLLGGPPSPTQSLGIEAVNVNGSPCSLVGGSASLAYGACAAPRLVQLAQAPGSEAGAPVVLVDFATTAGGGADSSGGGSGDCWAQFCCGVVLLDPLAMPPPPPPPSISAPPPAQLPPVDVPVGPAPGSGQAGSPAAPPPPPPAGPQPQQGSGGGSSVIVPAAAGGGGAAAALLLCGALLLLHRRRRRLRRLREAAQQAQRGAAASKADLIAAEASITSAGSLPDVGSPAGASSAPQSPAQLACLTLGSILTPMSLATDPSTAAPTATLSWPAGPAACQVSIAPSIPGAAASKDPRGSKQDSAPVKPGDRGSPAGGGGGGSGSDGSPTGSGASSRSGSSVDLVKDVILLEQLGSGAFGTVYRGEWQGRPVAVKVLQTACHSRSRELESFRQEARVLAGLRHPHIACLLAACTVPPNICIVEELAEGGSLHQRLHGRPGSRHRRPLPYGELLSVAADVAAAMCYLHPRIVHRDLKAQNVLLDAHGRAKVCDFGIAKFKDRTFVSTANGQAGTPAYMAPEMFDGKPITEKVDVFSFSVLCWEMLMGEVPWRQLAGPMQVIYQVGVLKERLPLPDACPPFLSKLIQDCWAEDPDRRPGFPAIRERLRAELARVAADEAQQAQRVACRSTVSETDASSAAAGASHAGSSSVGAGSSSVGSSRDGRAVKPWHSGSGAGGSAMPPLPATSEELCSPFAAHATTFSSSSSGTSIGR